MSRAGNKNVLPATAPRSSEVDYDRLNVPAGPWCSDEWLVDHRPGGTKRNVAASSCDLDSCTGTVHKSVDGYGLCYGHWWQWHRAGDPPDVSAWMASGAKPVQRRRRASSDHTSPLDLTRLPAAARTEFRLVVGTKVTRGDWTPSDRLRRVFDCLIEAIESAGDESFLDRRLEDWLLRTRQVHAAGSRAVREFDGWYAPYYRTFFATLHRLLLVDPWSEPKWLWRGCFDRLLGGPPGQDQANIDWGSICVPWLRTASQKLATSHLKAGSRSWGTILGWRRALIPLAEYLDAEGIEQPDELTREVFLDYLACTRADGASKNAMQGVTTAAKILELLKADRLVPSLPVDVYLRHGENAVVRGQDPQPYPEDVVDRIDNLVLRDPDLDRTLHAMLMLLRWGSPRVSELVTMPLECLKHNGEGGYWVEFIQFKTKRWRRFPIPKDLAQVLRVQQEWVRATFPAEHSYLFPSFGRSNVATGTARPWTGSGFRDAVRALFRKHGIDHSQITGETISGGHIHRYRHTVGTALLNSNWTMPEVQEFFAHSSSAMTSTYAKITHATLAKKAKQFHDQQQSDRLARGLPQTHHAVERQRTRYTAVLSDGYCMLPDDRHCDFRSNPCKDCAFHDPGGEEMAEVHAGHRQRLTLAIVQQSKTGQCGAQRINEDALAALDRSLARRAAQEGR